MLCLHHVVYIFCTIHQFPSVPPCGQRLRHSANCTLHLFSPQPVGPQPPSPPTAAEGPGHAGHRQAKDHTERTRTAPRTKPTHNTEGASTGGAHPSRSAPVPNAKCRGNATRQVTSSPSRCRCISYRLRSVPVAPLSLWAHFSERRRVPPSETASCTPLREVPLRFWWDRQPKL